MPKRRFVRDIELAKLQAKISNMQTATYAFVGVAFTSAIAFLALVFSPTVHALVEGWLFTAVIFICIIGLVVAAGLALGNWLEFQSVIRSDFDKIYRQQRIKLED
jgi:hypothetical protein